MRLTTPDDWNTSYENTTFYDLADHSISVYLQKHAGSGRGKHSIELGSFPGSFMPTIGRAGYTVHGVDFNPNNSTKLPVWLQKSNIKTGEFQTSDIADFCSDCTTRQYDLVCSFGLIEHFENFEEIILWHTKLVATGGRLIITTPNFRGLLQRIPHYLFDRENLKKHYLPSMNPRKWKTLLEANGFQVIHAGYFGGYVFWVDRSQKRRGLSRLLLRTCERSISQVNKLVKRLGLDSQLFSAYCGLVAVKNKPVED